MINTYISHFDFCFYGSLYIFSPVFCFNRNMKVEIWDVSGKNYTFSISSLYADIVPEQCTTKVRVHHVLFFLLKSEGEVPKWA